MEDTNNFPALHRLERIEVDDIKQYMHYSAHIGSWKLPLPELEKLIGIHHREMDEGDNEPGPAVYWHWRSDCGLIINGIYHLSQEYVEIITINDYSGEHLLHHLHLPGEPWWLEPNPTLQASARNPIDKTQYSLWRQDDNGGEYCIQNKLSKLHAECLLLEFEAKKHKQMYWIAEDTEGE
ncbi:MAG: hypothetical protein U0264_13165 [Candidatus Kapaibacterium sp.]